MILTTSSLANIVQPVVQVLKIFGINHSILVSSNSYKLCLLNFFTYSHSHALYSFFLRGEIALMSLIFRLSFYQLLFSRYMCDYKVTN